MLASPARFADQPLQDFIMRIFTAVLLSAFLAFAGGAFAQAPKIGFGEPAECGFDGSDGDHHINCLARCPAKSELVSGSCNVVSNGEALVLEGAGPGTDAEGVFWLCRYVDIRNLGSSKKMSDKVEVTATARCLQ
jgi:hypothetical protein